MILELPPRFCAPPHLRAELARAKQRLAIHRERSSRQRGFIINPFSFDAGPPDPDFANVVLLINADGMADASQSFTDRSGYGRTVGANANAQCRTADRKWGSGSVSLGSGSIDYLQCATSTDFDFGSGDFTIELWVYPTVDGTQRNLLTTRAAVGSDPGFLLRLESTNVLRGICWGPSAGAAIGDCNGGAVNLGSVSGWQWLQYQRSGSSFQTRIGASSGATATSSAAIAASTNPLRIGADANTGNRFVGYMDDIRITKGVARSTSVPTAAYPTH